MKNVVWVVAFILTGYFAFANSNTLIIMPKAETVEMFSEKFITYKIDNSMKGEASISVTENTFKSSMLCGFNVSWTTDEGSGSFWLDCSSGGTMDDILGIILALFF